MTVWTKPNYGVLRGGIICQCELFGDIIQLSVMFLPQNSYMYDWSRTIGRALGGLNWRSIIHRFL